MKSIQIKLPDDDKALCELAESQGARIEWSKYEDFYDHIKFTPDTLRAFIDFIMKEQQ
jgi:hypothetical protein